MPFAPEISPQADLAEIRGHLRDAATYALELRARPEAERGDTYVDDLRSAVDFINFADPIERALAAAQRGDRTVDTDARGPRGAFSGAGLPDMRSLGAQVVEAEGFEEWSRGTRTTPFVVDVPARDSEQRALVYLASSEPFDSFATVGQPIPPTPRQRRMFLRDLLGVQQTGLTTIPYIREKNPVTNEGGAAMTAEGSAKAEVTLQFEDAEAPVRKITAWVPVTSEILSDAPTLRGYINTRLAYMLDVREEQQLLKGNGTLPQLEGIYQVSGTQSVSSSADGQIAGDVPATVASAIGKVENVDMTADFVVYNPLDYWQAIATRHANQFDSGGNGNAPASVANMSWGLNELRTRALSTTECLVGSSTAATVYQREGTTIRVADQHEDYAVKNKVATIAERRIAFPIWRPDGFVEVTLDLTA